MVSAVVGPSGPRAHDSDIARSVSRTARVARLPVTGGRVTSGPVGNRLVVAHGRSGHAAARVLRGLVLKAPPGGSVEGIDDESDRRGGGRNEDEPEPVRDTHAGEPRYRMTIDCRSGLAHEQRQDQDS